MGVEAWSTTAASNNASPPNGAPEGMAPSAVNDTMRQIMASVRSWYEGAEWLDFGHTPTRLGNTSFSVTGDQTAIYHTGRRVKASGSSTSYATISSSSYSSVTTVNVTMDSGNLPATLSSVAVGIVSATNTSQPVNANPSWSGTATGANLTLSGTLTMSGTPIGVASGGTGANSVAGARSALGVSATGSDTTYAFRSNNLSDLASAATARSNLGVTATGADTTYAYRSNNLSDLTNAATARANLSVTATGSDTTYAYRSNNLSDLASAATARTNLGVPSLTGTGASGTWAINITGSAASATSASTASDASALNGQAASYYTNASNLASGTVPNARLPNVFAGPGVTIASDPGGTPTLAYGQVAAYY